jgi:hypothetical protein
VDPKQRELSVEPVQRKQQQAFGKCAHGKPSCTNVVKLRPYYARTPKRLLGGSVVTGGTRLVLMLYLDGEL